MLLMVGVDGGRLLAHGGRDELHQVLAAARFRGGSNRRLFPARHLDLKKSEDLTAHVQMQALFSSSHPFLMKQPRSIKAIFNVFSSFTVPIFSTNYGNGIIGLKTFWSNRPTSD